MRKSKHIRVCLTDAQRTQLETLIKSGNASARVQTRTRLLLLSDRSQAAAKTQAQIAPALLCSKNTVGSDRALTS